jgi:hypothetical protein
MAEKRKSRCWWTGVEREKSGQLGCPPGKEAPRWRQGLFEFFGHDGELELGFGKRLHDDGLGAFRRGVA